MKEKWQELVKDEAFVKAMNACKSEEEALEVLKKNGIEVSSLKELNALAAGGSRELSEEELEKVSGGSFCIVVGCGIDAGACWGEGTQNSPFIGQDGYGANACFLVGVGVGFIECKGGWAT